MSDLRPKGIEIKLGDKTHGLRFTLNAIDEIQERFDIAITELFKVMSDERKQYKNVAFVISILINEDIDCLNEDGEKRSHIDEKYVGRHITASTYKEAVKKIIAAFKAAAPESDGDDPTMSE